ncbi:MAG: ComEA family DNA-binding protein [Cyclobacteriaceae bacterium]
MKCIGLGLITLLFLALPQAYLHAQEPLKDLYDIENLIAELFPNPTEDQNYEDLYESLLLLYDRPVDLNSANTEALQSIFFLTEFQINAILTYRKHHGALLSFYELLYIDGFDRSLIEKMIPFITLKSEYSQQDKNQLIPKINRAKSTLLMRYGRRMEHRRGYETPDTTDTQTRYLGRPDHLYLRYQIRAAGDFSAGFTMEKDPGEPIRWDPANKWYGADFLSAHFTLEERGIIKKLIIGDFSLQSGHGLVFGAAFRMGKGIQTVNALRPTAQGLRSYTSVNEHPPQRGIGLTLGKKSVSLTTFYSSIYRSSSQRETDDEVFSASIRRSGLHRTPNEINGRKNLHEKSMGFNLSYQPVTTGLQIGINGVVTRFDKALAQQDNRYNQHFFHGFQNSLGSIYANYRMGDLYFFGEASRSESGGNALLAGWLGNIGRSLQASMLYRHYDVQFHSLYGNAFGESTINNNEQGLYLGLAYSPFKGVQIHAYVDRFHFPWLRYRIDAPSTGNDALLAISYEKPEQVFVRLQYRYKERALNLPQQAELTMYRPEPGTKHAARLDVSVPVGGFLWMHSRFRWSQFEHFNNTSGMLIAQDLEYKKGAWVLAGRFSVFDTEDFENRQYIYERDVLYLFSIPAWHGRGTRYYLTAKYDLSDRLSFWAKWGHSMFSRVPTIGSGLETIEGNTRSDIRIMCRIRW